MHAGVQGIDATATVHSGAPPVLHVRGPDGAAAIQAPLGDGTVRSRACAARMRSRLAWAAPRAPSACPRQQSEPRAAAAVFRDALRAGHGP